ncbi:MAG: nucleotidyltransferase domain-containing protein [Chloroflexi bacterium]|nr:nucleotidyltransferase domain-containing protein [Chloroflexota bacterium]
MATKNATEIPAEKMALYRASAAQRQASAEQARQARFAQAQRVAARAAILLKTEFGAQKVVVFGSLLQPALFHTRSDVDLAVWGIDELRYYRAVAQLLSLDPEISFDLVRFEEASPSVRTTILRDGVEI